MIKIDLNEEDKILEFHYKNLTNQTDREYTIIMFLNNRIKKFSNPLHQDKIDFYNYLKSIVIKNRKGFSILIAKPELLEREIEYIEHNYLTVLNSVFSINGKDKDGNDKIITVRNDLLKVFYYETYNKWKAYELAKKIGVNVCPYCNRNYTFILGTDTKDGKGTRFEYDHFFDKARYPYLALSFYNLVPSCHICNSNLKGSDKFNLDSNFHPYLNGFGKTLLFSIKPMNISFINGESESYRLKFRLVKGHNWPIKKIKSAIRNISVFELTALYNMHKDYIDEIIQKSIIYNQEYIEELYKLYEGNLFGSIDEVKRMVLGNYINEEDYSKRPLSKLTADISRELGLI